MDMNRKRFSHLKMRWIITPIIALVVVLALFINVSFPQLHPLNSYTDCFKMSLKDERYRIKHLSSDQSICITPDKQTFKEKE